MTSTYAGGGKVAWGQGSCFPRFAPCQAPGLPGLVSCCTQVSVQVSVPGLTLDILALFTVMY